MTIKQAIDKINIEIEAIKIIRQELIEELKEIQNDA